MNGPVFEGDLRTYQMQNGAHWVKAATLAQRDPAAQSLLPEPELVGIAPLAIQLRGIERHEGADGPYSVIQEWHCELP
jgi:hypothetical protein